MTKPFGCGILIYDPFKELTPEEKANGFQKADLDDLMARADVVTLHPRVTPETKGMISTKELEHMRKGAYLINASRGSVVDIPALIKHMQGGNLGGAALDVYPNEPGGNGPNFTNELNDWAEDLRGLKNIILTPHDSGASRLTTDLMWSIFHENVGHFVKGEPLTNTVDKKLGY